MDAITECIINNDQFSSNCGWGPLDTSVVGIDPETFLDAGFILKWKYKFSRNFDKLLELLETPGNVLIHEENLKDAEKLTAFRDDFLGSEIYISGQVRKNQLFNNEELIGRDVKKVEVDSLIEILEGGG